MPDEQGLKIGEMRQQRRRRKEKGRVMPSINRALGPEFGALLGDMAFDVEGFFGMAAQRLQASHPDLREIRAELIVIRPHTIVGQGEHHANGDYGHRQEQQTVAAHSFRREPASAFCRGQNIFHAAELPGAGIKAGAPGP